jgi:flagellar hook-basal body complex protein FliE
MAIAGVGGVGGVNLAQLAALQRQQVIAGESGGTPAARAQAGRGADFAAAIGDGLQTLENLDRTAGAKAIQAATGDLTDVHDYVMAATQAQVATELTTTIRNKALEAFNDIMRMPL